jgi:hypothetical protein
MLLFFGAMADYCNVTSIINKGFYTSLDAKAAGFTSSS